MSRVPAEIAAKFERAVLELPPVTRRIYILAAVNHMSTAEIAANVGIPLDSARLIFQRALLTLRSAMEDRGVDMVALADLICPSVEEIIRQARERSGHRSSDDGSDPVSTD